MKSEVQEKNKIKMFFEKNKKNILVVCFVFALACIAIIGIYKAYKGSDNKDTTIYENFAITKVTTKEGANRKASSDSTFIIETDKPINKESIEKRIFIEPSIDYTVKKINSKKYELEPTESLNDNQVYTIEEIKNQTVVYKWAFQTEKKLSVIDYSPYEYASKDDVIRISFSMPNIENFKENVTITSWVFKPSKEFKNGVTYTVKLSKGIKSGEYTLENDFSFDFSVSDYEANYFEIDTVTLDEINSFTPNETPKIKIIGGEESLKASIAIYKIDTLNDFKNMVTDKTSDTSKLTKVYDKNITIPSSGVIELEKTLETGYYIAIISSSGNTAKQLIQVTDVQNYVLSTENDTLVWTIKDGKAASGIKVELNGKSQTSDKDGIVKFKNINNGKNNKSFVTIDTDSKYPAIVQVKNYKKNNYPDAYIYTDRPIYKNTDTIKIWGYVPLNEFNSKAEDDFIICYGNSSKKVNVDKNGAFTTSINLKDNVDYEYFEILLKYKDMTIAYRSVEIYDYVKPTYSYEIKLDKNVFVPKDKISFDVEATHITGMPATNKNIAVRLFGKTYKAKTNAKGIAHFDVTAVYSENVEYDSYYIEVFTGDYEDENRVICAMKSIYVVNYDIISRSKIGGTNGNYSLEITANKLDTNKLKNTQVDGYIDLEKYIKGTYDSKAKVEIHKNVFSKVEDGSYYDDYSGKQIKEYRWDFSTELVDTFEVSLKNGKGSINNLKYSPERTDSKEISYYAIIKISDSKKNVYEYLEYSFYDSNGSDENSFDESRFYPYSYSFKLEKEKSNLNETVNYYLVNSSGNIIKNEGQVLTAFYKYGIVNENISSDKLSFKFTKDIFPGSYITGAYLINGKVYAIDKQYIDYNEEERNLNVSIKPDKEEYSPRDTVNVYFEVKDKKNNGAKVNLNVSVVDEAIFAIKDDETDLLESIYQDRYYNSFFASTNRNYYLSITGGMGDEAGGEARYNFKDTVLFKTITTDNNGKAKLSFKLPDNITKYRITVHAANNEEYLGVGKALITATQKFFVESNAPTNVKYNDDLVINMVSRGNDIKDKVSYTVKIDDKELTTTSNIAEYSSVNFGKLKLGEHDVTITATAGSYTDTIKYTIKIVGNTQQVPTETTSSITNELNIKPAKNPITLQIYDKKLDTYLKFLERLSSNYSSRVDTQISIYEFERLYSKFYEQEESENSYTILSDYVKNGLVKRQPNSSGEVLLTAIINKYAKLYFKREDINIFNDILNSAEAPKNIYPVYLGLAANKYAILDELDYLYEKDSNRNDEQNITLALAYAFIGDYSSASKVYKSLNIKVESNKVLLNSKEITNDDISSLIALLTSMIDKDMSTKTINILLNKNSTSIYLNFAIISYLENTTEEIEKNKSVTIKYGDITKKVNISGFKVESLDIDSDQLSDIQFINASKDLNLKYYYTSGIDDIKSKNIKKDVTATISKEVKKNSTVKLNIKYTNKSKSYSELRIAIPRGLSLDLEQFTLPKNMYIISEKKDYVIIGISNEVKKVNLSIPFVAVNDGSYTIEPIVIFNENNYHISNKMNINIKK